MIKTRKDFHPSLIFVLSLGVLFILVGYYYHFYIPAKKYQLAQRYFRQLAMMSSQFENTVQNASMLISGMKKDEYSLEQLGEDLSSGFGSLFSRDRVEPPDSWKKAIAGGKMDDLSPEETRVPKKYLASLVGLNFSPSSGTIDLYARVMEPVPGGGLRAQRKIGIKIEEFMKYVSPGGEFDDVLLLDENARVVYRRGRSSPNGIESGLNLIKAKALIRLGTGEEGSAADAQELFQNNSVSIKIGQVAFMAFVQPVSLKDVPAKKNACWYIAGLLSDETFSQRCRRIPSHLLLLFVFCVPLVFIGYPILKLLLMGPKDRLRVRDIVFLFMSFVFGIPALIYGIVNISEYYLDKFRTYEDLNALSCSVESRFLSEVQAAHRQLVALEKWIREKSPLTDGSVAKQKEQKEQKAEESRDFQKQKSREFLNQKSREFQGHLTEYKYLDMVFSVDDGGQQQKKTFVKQTPGGIEIQASTLKPISTRDYYLKTKRKEFWYVTYDGVDHPLVLDPVYSRTTGLFEINLAIPMPIREPKNEGNIIANVMSFRPLSVIRPILPCHHGFAVIERGGRVIFHSDTRLNLIENFFSECDNPARVQAAVFADAIPDLPIRVEYQGTRRDLVVRPIEGIPWFIVAFKDRDVCGAMSLATFIQAGGKYFLYSLFLASAAGLLLLFNLLQKRVADSTDKVLYRRFLGLWPRQGLESEYWRLAAGVLVAFMILLVRLYWGYPPPEEILGWPCLVAVLAYGVILRSLKKGRRREDLLTPGGLLVFWLIVALIFFRGAFFRSIWPPFLLVLSLWLYKPARETGVPRRRKRDRYAFISLVYALLLLLFAYPALFCFKTAYNEERVVSVQFAQLNLIRDYSSWRRWYKATYPYAEALRLNLRAAAHLCPIYHPVLFLHSAFIQPYSLSSRNDVIISDNPQAWPKDPKSRRLSSRPALSSAAVMDYLGRLVPFGDPYLRFTGFLAGLRPENAILDWWETPWMGGYEIDLVYREKYNLESHPADRALTEAYVNSKAPLERLTGRGIWFLAGETLAISLFLSFGLFGALIWLYPKLTLKGLAGLSPGTALLRGWSELIPGRVFIFGPSPADPGKNKGVTFLSGPEILSGKFHHLPGSNGVVITDLHAAVSDAKANETILKTLEDLVFGRDRDINVFSRFDPVQYFQHKSPASEKKADGSSEEETAEGADILDRWRRVMSRFEFRYDIGTGPYKDVGAKKFRNPEIRVWMDRECQSEGRAGADSGKALPSYQQPLKRRLWKGFQSLKIVPDSVAIKAMIAESAKPVYDEIWTTSTIEEKSALLQLASHGLLNDKNGDVVRNLLKRGLIKISPPRLMNETFRNYVRSAEDREAVLQWEKEAKDSPWARVKNPLLFFGIGIIVFMVSTQPGLLQTWVGIGAAVTGTIPAVLRGLDQVTSSLKKS